MRKLFDLVLNDVLFLVDWLPCPLPSFPVKAKHNQVYAYSDEKFLAITPPNLVM